MITPTFEELYDLHAPMLYGIALRLTGAPCAERALSISCLELWGTPAKCSQPCTLPTMVRVMVSHLRKQCIKDGTGEQFQRRLIIVMDELKERGTATPLG